MPVERRVFRWGLYKLYFFAMVLTCLSFICVLTAVSSEGWLYQFVDTGESQYTTNVGLVRYSRSVYTQQSGTETTSYSLTDLTGSKAPELIQASQMTMVFLVFSLVAAAGSLVFAALYVWSKCQKVGFETISFILVGLHFLLLTLGILVYGLARPTGNGVVFAGTSFYWAYILIVVDAILQVPALVALSLEKRARYVIDRKMDWPFRK
jgi:hypothetical protein